MLVHTIKVGEELVITLEDGTMVTVKITEAGGSRCRVGVAVPQEVRIMRAELDDRSYEKRG